MKTINKILVMWEDVVGPMHCSLNIYFSDGSEEYLQETKIINQLVSEIDSTNPLIATQFREAVQLFPKHSCERKIDVTG